DPERARVRRHADRVDGMSDDLAIETTGLTKRLGHTAVVGKVDLAVPRGSVYGFLGPNGSGKTTTIRMLRGLIWPTAGSFRLLGETMPAAGSRVLPQVGALVEGPAFYPWLTGRQNLRRIDAAGPDGQRKSRRQRIDDALARVGLDAAAGKRYRAYSLGMKQRLGLAAALLRPRSLLVLDEPTNGMDPQGTREIRNLVRELAAEGSTVFLSTHLLSEVEQLCTHLGIISVGKVVAQGSIEDLRGRGDAMLRVETEDARNAAQVLDGLGLEAIGVTGEVFSDQITNNGVFAALVGLTVTLPFFLPLAVAIVAGDAVAGEANLGTMRYLLSRPVGRTRLLVIKATTVTIFCFVATFAVAIAGLIAGSILFPIRDVTTLSGDTLSLAAGTLRIGLAAVLVALSLLGLA